MDIKYIGKLLVSSLFILSGLYSLIYKFDDFKGLIISIGIPLPILIAYCILMFKIIAGLIILLSQNEQYTKLAISGLIIFVVTTSILFHNPLKDESQVNNLLKNIAIVGGLLLLY